MLIGQNIPRVDGLAKLRGEAVYVDDIVVDGVLHGGTVRSQVARGRIRGVHFDPSIPWDEYTIVDHRDIAGANEVLLIERDQPALVAVEIRHKYEPILLIAHPSPSAVRRAVAGVRVEVEPLPAILDPCQAVTPELVQYGDDNVFKRVELTKGDVEEVFRSSPTVVEGEYSTGSQEHVYLENQGMLAFERDGQLVVQGSMQCPYYVLDSLTNFFGREADKFRVIQAAVGGGFGGKEDYPSILAIHAALLAEKSGKPVKIIYDRQEDMACTTKRHPSHVRHRTAVDDDGRLLAMDIEVTLDGGAYLTLSPVVLSRGVIHSAGPYRCDNVRVRGEARLTNTPPNGAFRGFGAPQTIFAVERHMDVIAKQLGMCPVTLRKRNFLRDGDTTATGQVVKDGVDMSAMLDRAIELSSYTKRREEHAAANAKHPYLKRGIAFSTFYHGAGFTGSGETWLKSEVWVRGLPDGRAEVLTANTDIGQGTLTILTQIAAESLGFAPDQIVVAVPDTTRVPNSGPTVASRTAMVVGKLVSRACAKLATEASSGDPVKGVKLQQAIRDWYGDHPGQDLLCSVKYETPPGIRWDDDTYRGDAYACYAWAVNVAEVEVDLRTFATRVTDFVALQEVGKVIHPVLARGQIQGGVAQGIGWALLEEVVTADGGMKNNQMTNYVIPACSDLPPIRVWFEEQPSQFGPGGAKGIGELPMDGPAPAIVNAICGALDTSVCSIPITPERLFAHLEGSSDG